MKDIKKWHIAGLVFALIIGILLQFAYVWSNENKLVGIFATVNESTWEHCKILFWPLFIFGIVEYFYIGKEYKNYFYGKMVGLYIGIIFIISFFYIYTGIIGDNFFIVDLMIFIASVIISQYFSYKFIVDNDKEHQVSTSTSLVLIVTLALAFILFTFYPPHINLFRDPMTGLYGIG